jgi:hypothetical protein
LAWIERHEYSHKWWVLGIISDQIGVGFHMIDPWCSVYTWTYDSVTIQ